jgi:putative transcriptional regulator
MKAKDKNPRRLTQALLETAKEMHGSGTLDDAAYDKITMRHVGKKTGTKGIAAEEIKSLRERARLSQAVFAQYLNVTPGYVSQLERGVKRPTGPALVLLNVIRRKGIDVIL